jgi:DNA-binding CsgD family transcriptional regulator
MTLDPRPQSSSLLYGRDNECQVLDALLAATRGGDAGAICLHGEPGIGKTELLNYAVGSASDFRLLRTAGSEAEMELAYASLQEFFRPGLSPLGQLPGPQRRALEIVLGRQAGVAPDPMLVGLALLNVVSALSAERPVLCVVDDAQWLDSSSAQVIGFAARHASKDAVAFLFATRSLTDEIRGLPQLALGGLGDRDARALLATVLPDRLDDRVIDRVIAETHGNPLAILELPKGLSPAQLAGGFGLPVSVTLADQIEQSYRRRLARLPEESRRLLLVVAADPTGNSEIIWRAADELGIAEEAAEAIERDGLIEFAERVVFHHPLVRSAVYNTASPKDRREVHRALGHATDRNSDPDRRVWHLAQATIRPNKGVADELEASADRAQSRGGFAAAGAFLERSVGLTSDPEGRAVRALRAAQAKLLAGALDSAGALAAVAERGPLNALNQAQLDALMGQIAFARNRGNEVSPRLLKAASRLGRVDADLARETYLDALNAAIFSGSLATEADLHVVARAARVFLGSVHSARPQDLLLDGLTLLITDGYKSGSTVLKKAVRKFTSGEIGAEDRLRWSWLASGAAGFIWDYEGWDALTAELERLARDVGALSILPMTLSMRVGTCLLAGQMADAEFLVDQVQIVTDASDNTRLPNAALTVAAFRGDELEARKLIDATIKDSQARGEGMAITVALWAKAVLCNSRGHYEEALHAASETVSDRNNLWFWAWAAVEFIEAASRTGNVAQAIPVLERLAESTDAGGSDWALGIKARCCALLSDGKRTESLYQEALERLLPTRLSVEVARTRLLYGEWLRRQQRQKDARDQLRRAHDDFEDFGMSGFAERAGSELLATGERARKRTVETSLDLTPQEVRISELASQGATNQDIAGQLFISPATVEYHLSKVYRKLGIRSRTQLANTFLQLGRQIASPEDGVL